MQSRWCSSSEDLERSVRGEVKGDGFQSGRFGKTTPREITDIMPNVQNVQCEFLISERFVQSMSEFVGDKLYGGVLLAPGSLGTSFMGKKARSGPVAQEYA
jgi:hypothetical protein